MKRYILPTLVLFFVTKTLSAQVAKQAITLEDYASVNTILEIAVSPDGKHLAYTLATWDKAEDNRKSDLWVVPVDQSSPAKRLTFDRANDRSIVWSKDSSTIYFLGNRKRAGETKAPYDGTTQVWQIEANGKELRPVTREAGGISAFAYSTQEGHLYFSKDRDHSDPDEFSALRSKYKVEYGHGHRKVTDIYRLDLHTWRIEKKVSDTRYIREFVVSPDGQRIGMITAFDDTVVKSEGESRVDIWEQGKIVTPPTECYRAKAASPYAWLEHLVFLNEGKAFAFCAVFDAYPAEIVIGQRTDSGWTTELMPRTTERKEKFMIRGYGSPLFAHAQSQVLVFLAEKEGSTVPQYYSLEKKGLTLPLTFGKEQYVYAMTFDNKGVLYEVKGTSRSFAKLTMSDGTETRVLVDPNPHTEKWKLPTNQHITWKASDGSTIGGILQLPADAKPKEKLPLVVAIHGGPTTASYLDLRFDPHNGGLYFAAHGYAVLFPNYRGSTGYGDTFVTDLIGHENDVEVKDILAGIQHLVNQGIADPERIACMGWSNGGYLTNCLITLKNPPVKLKAASSGAGILDTVAEWGFNDEPAYPIVFKKGLPWEQPEIYKKTSPTYGLGNVVTPTLIHVGGGDERCPPGHSRMLYRALKENLKVPTQLMVYPNEPHGLTKLSHRVAKMEWDLAWFDKYVKNASTPKK